MVTQNQKLITLPQSLTPFPLNFIPTELREDGFQPQTYLVQGVKALHTALKLWMKKEVSSCLWWNNLIFIWQGQESEKCEIVSLSVVSMTLCNPMDCSPSRLLYPWNPPGKNTGVGSHSLLQGIFPTQGLNLGLLCCRQILYHLSPQGNC